MDVGNDVDLSNKNITPLWRRRADYCNSSRDTVNSKPRPISYHFNGVATTDFPVEDSDSTLTLCQPEERLVVTAPSWGKNTVVLKHVLHKPTRKARIIRSISIGHLSNGLFSLSKFKSEGNPSASLDNRVCNRDVDSDANSNGGIAWPDKSNEDHEKRLSILESSRKDHTGFGTSTPSSEVIPLNGAVPLSSPGTPNNNTYNHHELSSLSSVSNSSPLSQRTPTPSYSSTSSIPSLISLNSSDPPTPRSPSPADGGQTLCRPSMCSPPQDARHASSSSSSSLSPTSPSPSRSPTISPNPSIVLSTNSPAAMKMGTQQLIPKGLASDVRLSKTSTSGQQNPGLPGQLGIDHSRRALKALSMVETGSYFSTGAKTGEGGDGDSESPGSLRRGLRSTSYRRAVIESEAPAVDLKCHGFSQLHLKVPDVFDGANLGSPKITSPGTPKSPSSGTPKSLSLGTPKLPSPKNLKATSPGKVKVCKHVSPTTRQRLVLDSARIHSGNKCQSSERRQEIFILLFFFQH